MRCSSTLPKVLQKTAVNRNMRCSAFSRPVSGILDNSDNGLLGTDKDNCVNSRKNNGRNETSRRYAMAIRMHPIDPIKFRNSARRSRFCWYKEAALLTSVCSTVGYRWDKNVSIDLYDANK